MGGRYFAAWSVPALGVVAPIAAGVVGLGAIAVPTEARADRCTRGADGSYRCAMINVNQSHGGNTGTSCTGKADTRTVVYQVPEGTPPAGGWPVAFWYNGTTLIAPRKPDGPTTYGPFSPVIDAFGFRFVAQTLHELLDDPTGTGKKYAVVMPAANNQLIGLELWDTNRSIPYETSSDACFLPALWSAMAGGAYGPASNFNLDRRYAFGFSSGAYNTSRMAVSWNADNVWKALVIQSGSYATCLGLRCSVPASQPANNPPTKFYHGRTDLLVPISTMYPYHDRLAALGVPTALQINNRGHVLTSDLVGPTGVKAWFDRY